MSVHSRGQPTRSGLDVVVLRVHLYHVFCVKNTGMHLTNGLRLGQIQHVRGVERFVTARGAQMARIWGGNCNLNRRILPTIVQLQIAALIVTRRLLWPMVVGRGGGLCIPRIDIGRLMVDVVQLRGARVLRLVMPLGRRAEVAENERILLEERPFCT